MYTVLLFHDNCFSSCAKSEQLDSWNAVLAYLAEKLNAYGEYESAEVLEGALCVLRYSKLGV